MREMQVMVYFFDSLDGDGHVGVDHLLPWDLELPKFYTVTVTHRFLVREREESGDISFIIGPPVISQSGPVYSDGQLDEAFMREFGIGEDALKTRGAGLIEFTGDPVIPIKEDSRWWKMGWRARIFGHGTDWEVFLPELMEGDMAQDLAQRLRMKIYWEREGVTIYNPNLD